MQEYLGEKLNMMEKLAYQEARRAHHSSEKRFLSRILDTLANGTNRIAATPLNLSNWPILKFQNVKISDQQVFEVMKRAGFVWCVAK